MKNRKFKFNYVDIIIILLVAAAFVVGYKFINKTFTHTAETPDVSFTVEVKSVPEDYEEMFAEGDEVRDAVKGDVLGKITDISSKPATDVSPDSVSGQYRVSEYPDREDVYITIEGTPSSYGANIIIAQQEIKVGNMIYFKKPGAVGRGYIVAMDVGEAESK